MADGGSIRTSLIRGNLPKSEKEQPGPFTWNGQISDLSFLDYGSCDPYFWDQKQSGEAWRYSTAFLQFTRTGAGNLLCAANQTIDLFNYGSTETVPAAGVNINGSYVQTDNNKSGAPIKEGEKFFASAAGVQVLRPFCLIDDGNGNFTQFYRTFLQTYAPELVSAVVNGVAMKLTFGDEACEYSGSPLNHWPHHGGELGANLPRVGNAVGPAQIAPFRRWFKLGARDETDQLTLQLLTDGALQVEGNALAPVPADQLIVVPVLVTLYGKPECTPMLCKPCGNDGGDNGAGLAVQIAAMKAAGLTPEQITQILAARGR